MCILCMCCVTACVAVLLDLTELYTPAGRDAVSLLHHNVHVRKLASFCASRPLRVCVAFQLRLAELASRASRAGLSSMQHTMRITVFVLPFVWSRVSWKSAVVRVVNVAELLKGVRAA